MSDFASGVLVGIFGLWAFQHLLTAWVIRREEKLVKKLEQEITQYNQDNNIWARVEEHGGQYYLYNATNDEFLAQGSGYQDLLQKVDSIHPGKTVVIGEGEWSVRNRLKQELKAQQ